MRVCVYVCVYACVCVCMYVCACMCVCCVCVCMCMCVCVMCVHVCVCIVCAYTRAYEPPNMHATNTICRVHHMIHDYPYTESKTWLFETICMMTV